MRNRSDAVGGSRISISLSIPVTIPAPGDGGSDASGNGAGAAAGPARDDVSLDITVTYRIDAYAGEYGDSVAGYVLASPVRVTRGVSHDGGETSPGPAENTVAVRSSPSADAADPDRSEVILWEAER